MSSFIVSDPTINRVVSYLARDKHNASYAVRRLREELGITSAGSELGKELGVLMSALNIAAVSTRYNEENAVNDYRFKQVLCTKIQALKSLRCWIYQCSEGDIPERPLYKIMDEYADSLAWSIINAMPEYDAAEWDAA
jgi:hypothetical protein